MKASIPLTFFGLGLLLAGFGLVNLKSREEGLRHHRNPFAIQQSGYGKTLARLSQDTVDVVWHLGIEQVNPIGHVHGQEGHDHDHDHDHDHHESENSIAASLEPPVPVHLDAEARQSLMKAGIEPAELHCQECADTLLSSIKNGELVSAEDVPAIHAFHQLADSEESGHDHAHHDHDHEIAAVNDADAGWLATSKEWLRDLRAAAYDRTSPFAVSEAHQKAVAADIENMLLRAYKMDPTDFGVYNGYFLFLTIHELRATPVAKDHARLISRMTVSEAMKEEIDPQPWLTACMATLNLFFLDQQEYGEREEPLPVALLEEFKQQMVYCLHRYELARELAKSEGRWELISEQRRESMRERERFSRMALDQFDTLLARAVEGRGTAPNANPAAGEGATVRLGENSNEDAEAQ